VSESNGALSVTASGPGLAAEADAELWLALTEDHLVVEVKRGENANKTLKHSGVVRILRSAGTATAAGSTSLALAPGWRRENLRVVAFVQSRKNRKILSIGIQ
jgi:hypothetical protein